MSGRRVRFLVAAGLLALPSSIFAQTTGSIRGDVASVTGTPVPGASAVLTGEPIRGAERKAVTGPNGEFFFTGLPTGLYSVRAEAGGFSPREVTELRVRINTTTSVSIVLAPMEQITEELTVTSESPLINLTGSDVGNNYSADFLEDLPTRRNMWDIISVSPGMSQSDEGNDRQVAFGSSVQSNSWHVDGLDTSAPETGSAWWYVNPDVIAEIQVLGIGAPAEFGNLLGAAFNVVTKSGTNDFKGTLNAFYQSGSLTDENVGLADTDHPHFTRTEYHDLSLVVGGPLKHDRAWFFAAAQTVRDAIAQPGVDPNFAPVNAAERYDLKFDVRINDANQLSFKGHSEDFSIPEAGSAFVAPSASGFESGTNPAWGLGFSSVLNAKNLFEFHYAGWKSDDHWKSQTGSTEPPFVDYSPPGGGPPVYSGGVLFPFDYNTDLDQADVKLSHFADDFIKGSHDFRFGVQYSNGSAATDIFAGAGGSYYYRYEYYPGYPYYYKYTFTPFRYGAKQDSAAAFADDSWKVSDRLTLNLGVRYDHSNGWIPSYPRLDDQGHETAVKLPGINDVIDWNTISPRLGFAWVATRDQKTVVRGSAGEYRDGNVSGNWDYPPPGVPPTQIFLQDPETGLYDTLLYEIATDEFNIDPDLQAPRTYQYALGADRQFGDSWSAGAQLVYKDTDNLVGWEILGDGVYEPFLYTDPETGKTFQLANIIEQPTVRKGNRPGPGSLAGAGAKYEQKYRALLLTFQKHFGGGGSLQGSYTYSKSTGLIPRMLSDTQFNPFYGSREGADPNNFINADQYLQGDRKHMFRLEGDYMLPWDLELNGVVNLQSGRAYNRQTRVPLNQGLTRIIVEPASDDMRLPSTTLVDLAIGKRFKLPRGTTLKVDAQVFNVFNEDAPQFWETLALQPGDRFVPSDWVLPRRVMLRLGLEF